MPQQHARNWEEPFTEDCPTVSPTPIQERTSEEMNRSLFLSTGAQPGAASSATTPGVDEHPNRVFKGVLDESKFTEKSSSLPSKASHNNGEAKGRALANSTRTDTTRVYEGEGTAESPFIVDWSDNDPQNPMRWSLARKSSIVVIAGVSTLCVAYSSSAYAGSIPPMLEYFSVSRTVCTLGITFFLVGFAIGPMLWAPLSEIFGRRPIFLIAYGPFVLFSMGCALSKNIETMLVLRLLGGAFGSCPVTNSGGVTADLFAPRHRGLAMSLFAVAPFLGPTLGPICSGFLSSSSLGWRANFWLMAIFAFVCFIANVFLVPETYAPVLLRKRAAKLSKESGLVYISALDAGKPFQTVGERFRTSIFRPFILLATESIVACWAVYIAYIYAVLYSTFASFPIIFGEMRGWSISFVGLAFVGMLVGAFLGNIFYFFENRRYMRKLENNNGLPLSPEERLPLTIIGAILMPIALFILAFTSYPHVHWIGSVIAGVPFGTSQYFIFLCSQTYMLDTYLAHAASALAANAILRALLGSVFPLFIDKVYHGLGNVWASALMAFIALAGAPIPYIFWKFGPRIRRNSKYAPGHASHKTDTSEQDPDQVDADARQALDRRESIRETEEEREHTLHHRPEERA